MNKILFSSNKEDWETPQWLFEQLNKKYNFDIDVCASDLNHKCKKYYSINENGLEQEWNGNIWCNPPYGRKIGDWVKKGYESSLRGNIVVMLLPSRTDTKWFQDYCLKGNLTFIRGRLKFSNSDTGAPFPSVIVVFGGKE